MGLWLGIFPIFQENDIYFKIYYELYSFKNSYNVYLICYVLFLSEYNMSTGIDFFFKCYKSTISRLSMVFHWWNMHIFYINIFRHFTKNSTFSRKTKLFVKKTWCKNFFLYWFLKSLWSSKCNKKIKIWGHGHRSRPRRPHIWKNTQIWPPTG